MILEKNNIESNNFIYGGVNSLNRINEPQNIPGNDINYYNNIIELKRKSFNCLNNNIKKIENELFNLSPNKNKSQNTKKSFLRSNSDYFNCNNFNMNIPPSNFIEDEFYNSINLNKNEFSENHQINPSNVNPNFFIAPNINKQFSNMKKIIKSNITNNDINNNFNEFSNQKGNIPIMAPYNIINNNYDNVNNSLNYYNSNIFLHSKIDPRRNSHNQILSNTMMKNPLNLNNFNNNPNNTPIVINTNFIKNKKIKQNNQTQSSIVPNDTNIIIDDNLIIQNLHNFFKDQNGCRLLQKKIEEKKFELIMAINKSIVKSKAFIDIVNDQFGNYVIQKFLEIVFKEKIIMTNFFESIHHKIFDISINLYGTRVLQKALDLLEKTYHLIENESINGVFKKLVLDYMIELIIDINGNHVFMKIIGIYPNDKNDFIYEELFIRSKEIARLKQGGTVIQKAFEKATKIQRVLFVDYLKNLFLFE